MNWIDFIIVGIVGISVFFGVRKGFLFSLFSLLALVAGFFMAGYISSLLSPILGRSRLVEGLVFTGLFVVCVVLAYAAGRLLLFLTHILISGMADRLLGVAVGVLRGLLICGLFFFFLLLLDVFNVEPVRKSRIAPRIIHSMKVLAGKAPASVRNQFVKFSPDR